MRKKNNIVKMTDREWAATAARLSGEANGSANAEELSNIEKELGKQWNDITMMHKDKEIDIDKAWMKVSNKITTVAEEKERITVRPLLPLFLRVAASVIIVFGLGWAGFRMVAAEKVTIATADSEKNINISLPDGSRVWLNRNSSLTYPSKFSHGDRKVTLTGEAFFDITRDESKPFIIDAGKAKVKVLGTSFNVITNNGNNEVEVLVASGSVLVTSNNGEKSVTLKPGFVGKVSDSKSTSEFNSNTNYMSWNTEKLSYNGQTLRTVFEDLRRAYGIDIKANDPAIYNYTLTTIFDGQPHDTIIKVICTTFNLNYVKDDESYLLMRK
jgi:transmembrane sensor